MKPPPKSFEQGSRSADRGPRPLVSIRVAPNLYLWHPGSPVMSKKPIARLRLDQLEDRQVPSTLDLTGVEWRTIDGTHNNLALPNQGAAGTRQIRFGYGAQFPDGYGDA